MEKKAQIVRGALLSLVIFFTLTPYLLNGFWSDDLINSSVYGFSVHRDLSLGSVIAERMLSWLRSGRVFPLAISLITPAFFYIREVEFFRWYQVILIGLNVFLFFHCIKLVTRNCFFAFMSVLSLALLFQVITYQDPMASFGGLLQWVMLFVLLTQYFFYRYLRKPRKLFFTLSVLFFCMGLLTYEVAFVSFFIIAVAVFFERRNNKERIFLILPFTLCFVLYFLVAILFRHSSHSVHDGISVAINQKVLPTFFKQLSGSFPLSFFFGSPRSYTLMYEGHKFLLGDRLVSCLRSPVFVSMLSVIFLSIFFILRMTREKLSGLQVFVSSLFLVIVPAFLISLSPKYQNEIGWGSAYLPVYVQYFGVAPLIAVFLVKLAPRKNIFIALFLTLLIGFNIARNRQLIDVMDSESRIKREVFADALKLGLLKGADGPFLLVLKNFGFSGCSVDFMKTFFPQLPRDTQLLDIGVFTTRANDFKGYEVILLEATYHAAGINFDLQNFNEAKNNPKDHWEFYRCRFNAPDAKPIPSNLFRQIYQNPYQACTYRAIAIQ